MLASVRAGRHRVREGRDPGSPPFTKPPEHPISLMHRTQICQAIQEHRLLSFSYEGHTRVVEPHLYGRTTAGHDALRAWQVRGFSSSGTEPRWRLYVLEKMGNLRILNETFRGPRPDHSRSDRTMVQVYCSL